MKFDISLKPGLATTALDGRLLLIINSTNRPSPREISGAEALGQAAGNISRSEPRLALEDADAHGPFAFGRDAVRFTSGRALTMDDTATASLHASLARPPAGRYFVQALLDISTDLRSPNAAGNLMSEVAELQLDAHTRSPVKLELSRRILEEQAVESDLVKFVKIPSRLLSEFHHHPMVLRAGVILPRTHAGEPERRYPLWIHLGGFGARYHHVDRMMEAHSSFRALWLATNAPQMIYVLPDGAGPNGDPYQVNSANNGPYGDALTQEMIPWIESHFRGVGGSRGRVLSGRSTGGWVALALQIFYPDFFDGAWASSPDSVDFRAFELVNIYEDRNAFVNAHGEERPSAREANGDVRLAMRREVQMENVLGQGGQWTRSSGQWGAWNAVYGPRGADGRPVPLWDARGAINPAVAAQWEKYDLRLVLEKNWPTLAPKLRGKLHVSVGEADDYFLNNAVHRLDESLAEREPKDVAKFAYGPGQGHGWMSVTLEQLMEQVYAATQPATAARE